MELIKDEECMWGGKNDCGQENNVKQMKDFTILWIVAIFRIKWDYIVLFILKRMIKKTTQQKEAKWLLKSHKPIKKIMLKKKEIKNRSDVVDEQSI